MTPVIIFKNHWNVWDVFRWSERTFGNTDKKLQCKTSWTAENCQTWEKTRTNTSPDFWLGGINSRCCCNFGCPYWSEHGLVRLLRVRGFWHGEIVVDKEFKCAAGTNICIWLSFLICHMLINSQQVICFWEGEKHWLTLVHVASFPGKKVFLSVFHGPKWLWSRSFFLPW